ncbi:MAG TPA: hypothetical protein VGO80_01745 [Solirubrobacteraceae bacterium]|jgi:hypothetical protein|nr:hypothetical protein [Solirubrobacteraceae bacterium]
MSTASEMAFVAWIREGIAAEDGGDVHASVHVAGVDAVETTVRVLGAGDVTGLDPAQVVRMEPRPGSATFEPNYLACIELRRPSLPWLFSPPAQASGGVPAPWLCLVVVRRQEGVEFTHDPRRPLATLTIEPPARPADELPDLHQAWAWVHAQDGDAPRARLLCGRRLAAATPYAACLVPTFAAGVQAGLGLVPSAAAGQPAWDVASAPERIALPVYWQWEFSTSAEGDFQSLVQRLKPGALPADVGVRRLDVGRPGGGVPAGEPHPVALRSVLAAATDPEPRWEGDVREAFESALAPRLDAGAGAGSRLVAPPLYGNVATGADHVPAADEAPAWLRQVNLDPRLRVAAAAGAEVVRARQEQLMATAWQSVGALHDANERLRRAQLAREVGQAILAKHLRALRADQLVSITRPAHATLMIDGQTVDAQVRESRLPDAALSAPLRRVSSAQGPLVRRAWTADREPPPLSLVGAMATTAAMAPPGIGPGAVVARAATTAAAAGGAPPLSPDAVAPALLLAVDPAATVGRRLQSQVSAPPAVWQRVDPLEPLLITPDFPQPMYEAMRDVAPELLLSGAEHIQPDSVALLAIDRTVIEAFMLGLNHEMSRELLWREFPADLTGSPFRQFWQRPAGAAASARDVAPVREWRDTALGSHMAGGGGEPLALVLRGELMNRYPAARVYACPADRTQATARPRLADAQAPVFEGSLDAHTRFLGFTLPDPAPPARLDWFFVFEERVGEPRFGFEVAPTDTGLAWEQVPLTKAGFADMSPISPPAPGWGQDSATTALLALQTPYRAAIHASVLLAGLERVT